MQPWRNLVNILAADTMVSNSFWSSHRFSRQIQRSRCVRYSLLTSAWRRVGDSLSYTTVWGFSSRDYRQSGVALVYHCTRSRHPFLFHWGSADMISTNTGPVLFVTGYLADCVRNENVKEKPNDSSVGQEMPGEMRSLMARAFAELSWRSQSLGYSRINWFVHE